MGLWEAFLNWLRRYTTIAFFFCLVLFLLLSSFDHQLDKSVPFSKLCISVYYQFDIVLILTLEFWSSCVLFDCWEIVGKRDKEVMKFKCWISNVCNKWALKFLCWWYEKTKKAVWLLVELINVSLSFEWMPMEFQKGLTFMLENCSCNVGQPLNWCLGFLFVVLILFYSFNYLVSQGVTLSFWRNGMHANMRT